MSEKRFEEIESLVKGNTMLFISLAGILIDKGVLDRSDILEHLQKTADFTRSQMGEEAAEPIEAAGDLLKEFEGVFSETGSAMTIASQHELLRRLSASRRDGPGDASSDPDTE